MKFTREFWAATLLCGVIVGSIGCGGKPAAPGLAQAAETKGASSVGAALRPPGQIETSVTTALSKADIARIKPNEAGSVPILEYHAIDNGKTTYSRSPARFRADLDRLYQEGYRPVSLEAYLDNRIDVPAGKSPVIFTFDDARPTQFAYRPDGSLDPNCALGILEAFHTRHPDFPVKATFYVLPTAPGFGPATERPQKMEALLKMGCEIGNHTITHTALKKLSDTQVQQELAQCVTEIHKLAPEAKVDTMALPLGSHAKNRALEAAGEYRGQKYAHRAVLLVGAEPAPSPVSPKFKPLRLPRIQACEGDAGITYWLDELKRHPASRYVSDGDPTTVTIPRAKLEKIDRNKLQGATLRPY